MSRHQIGSHKNCGQYAVWTDEIVQWQIELNPVATRIGQIPSALKAEINQIAIAALHGR